MDKVQKDKLKFTMKVKVGECEAKEIIPIIINALTELLQTHMVGLTNSIYMPKVNITMIKLDRYKNEDIGAIVQGISMDRFIDLENEIYSKFKYINIFKNLSKDFNKDIEVYFYDPHIKMEKHLKINRIDERFREYVETNVPVNIIPIDYKDFKTHDECLKYSNGMILELLEKNDKKDVFIKGDYIIRKGNKNIIRENIVAVSLEEVLSSTNCKLEEIIVMDGELITGGLGYYKNNYQFSI